MFLTNAAIKNRTTVLVLVVLIVFAGLYSYFTLPREAAPDVPIPRVLISTPYEGVSPEDIETQVTMEIERELTGLKGLKEIRSTSAEGLSLIMVEFTPGIEIEDALQRVRDKVDLAKAELPDEADEPVIKEINIAEFPIMIVSITGPISPVRLKAIADVLEDAIEQVPGVLNVDVLGALEPEIRIEIDQDRLTAYDFTLTELLALIPSENKNISAGGLETAGTKFNVRVPGEFEKAEEMDNLLLTMRGDKPIYLNELARVRDAFKDREGYARLDGSSSITVSIQKRIGANIVVIAEAVKAILEQFRQQAPMGVRFDITLDFSKDIRQIVSDLENNILTGLILVVAVLMVFLGLRTSLVVALAIPLSMFMSFAAIQALGYTLNMIVLFGLILALGMLVDNAIVIVENVYRHRQLGAGRIDAAMKGTGEVAWPVITSTATTLAAFSPLLFWPGIVGDFMKYLPIVLIITLSSSLFVALVISPVICTVVAGSRAKRRTEDRWFLRGYRRLLSAALSHWYATLLLAAMVLAGVALGYVKWGRGREFFPKADPRRAIINIRSPQGTNIKESDRLAGLVEQRVRKYREHLDHVVTNVGSSGGAGAMFGGVTGGAHVANLTLIFHDFEDRKRPSPEVVAEIRNDLRDIGGAEVKVEEEQHGPPTGATVEVRIIGQEFEELEALSQQVKQKIIDVPGLVNLRSDLEATRPELVFLVDRRRAMLQGVNTTVIGNFLKTAVFGWKVSTYRLFNDEYDITVRLPESQRSNIEDLFRLRVPNAAGQAVPLSSLGEFGYKPGFGEIHRVDQKRVVTLTGDAEGRTGLMVLKDVQDRLKDFRLPSGYDIRLAGEKEEEAKAKAFLIKAFVIALLLIVGILVTQFNTLTAPLIIISTVGLSMIGVLTGLLINRMPFGIIMTGIGVISLAGVVVNNAIVLLDYTRKLQRRGLELVQAAVQAGVTRLRPVLLTATTTILGLMPMATGKYFDFRELEWVSKSESSQWWRSMAIAVIYGLGFATVLTLVVVPTLYVTLYRLSGRFGLGGLTRPAGELAAAAPEFEDY